MAGERGIQFRQTDARIGDQRLHVMLGGVEQLHVEPDQPACGILEQRP